MRILAIDLGEKRTGLALGDTGTAIVSPLPVIEASGHTLQKQLVDAIRAQEPDLIVIGLPLNMDDTEGPAAKLVREIGAKLAKDTSIDIQYQDERLTSFAADSTMARSGRTHKQKKQLRDSLAASHILRDYLEGRTTDPRR